MIHKPVSSAARWLSLLCLLFVGLGTSVRAADFKFQAFLVWATDADSSPNPAHKPLDPAVVKELKDQLPLRWKNYFAVTNTSFVVASQREGEGILTDKCRVRVKDVNGKTMEVSLISKGEPVLKRIQPVPKDRLVVFGGNAPSSTGWLAVVKRVE